MLIAIAHETSAIGNQRRIGHLVNAKGHLLRSYRGRSSPSSLFFGLNLLLFLKACGGSNKYVKGGTADPAVSAALANAPPPVVLMAEKKLTVAVNGTSDSGAQPLHIDLSRHVAVFSAIPLVWTVPGGLPRGMSLHGTTGVLSGSPVVASGGPPLTFTVNATQGRITIISFQIEVLPRLRNAGLDATASRVPVLIEGTAASENLSGGAGDDELEGRAGGDVVDGGPGFDFASYRSSPQRVSIDLYYAKLLQDDTAVNRFFAKELAAFGGDAEGDVLRNIEGLIGTRHDDTLAGDDGDNIIYGLEGGDQIKGRGGRDLLFGGPGIDFLDGGPGADLLDGGDGAHDTADYAKSLEGVYVNLQLGIGRFGDAEGDRLVRIENLIGSDHGDTLIGDDKSNMISGGKGDDRIYGGGGIDRLRGGDGDDLLVGGAKQDFIWGGDGKDRFDISDTQAGQTNDLATDMIYDYEQGETLIIAPNQGTVWYRKVSGDPKFRGDEYIYIFNSQAAAVENIYVRLRNFEGTIDSSVFLSDGIDQVELVRLPDII